VNPGLTGGRTARNSAIPIVSCESRKDGSGFQWPSICMKSSPVLIVNCEKNGSGTAGQSHINVDKSGVFYEKEKI
jgi:hypothetical protein